jgi:hypothetical protein
LTCRNFLLAATLSIVAASSHAQQPPVAQQSQQPGSYSLQVNSQIVVLDVVVNNKKGEPVPNLTRDDFKVYENKVPQTTPPQASKLSAHQNRALSEKRNGGRGEP